MSAADWPVTVDPVYGCWRWDGKVDETNGYPYLWLPGRKRAWAHRHVWETERGAIPPGMEIEHGCKRRTCTNPAHLELVTRAQNQRLKSWRQRVKRTHCPNGHDLFLLGRLTPEGGKICLRCSGIKPEQTR